MDNVEGNKREQKPKAEPKEQKPKAEPKEQKPKAEPKEKKPKAEPKEKKPKAEPTEKKPKAEPKEKKPKVKHVKEAEEEEEEEEPIKQIVKPKLIKLQSEEKELLHAQLKLRQFRESERKYTDAIKQLRNHNKAKTS